MMFSMMPGKVLHIPIGHSSYNLRSPQSPAYKAAKLYRNSWDTKSKYIPSSMYSWVCGHTNPSNSKILIILEDHRKLDEKVVLKLTKLNMQNNTQKFQLATNSPGIP